jgi:ADP-heptose:LPS heptosyltransferase
VPIIELTRALTYRSHGRLFKRGVPQEVPTGMYHQLIRTGHFTDPRQRFNPIHPKQLPDLDKNGHKVTIIRDMGMGDVLMMMPTVQAIRSKFPNLKMRYAVKEIYVPMFRDFGVQTIPIEQMEGKHTVIDYRGYSERAEDRRFNNRIDVYANYARLQLEDRSIRLRVYRNERMDMRVRLQEMGRDESKPLIGVAVRGSTAVRTIPEKILREFVDMAIREGFQVILFDHEQIGWTGENIIDATGAFSIRELVTAVSMCDVTVSSDTGIYHVANAVETPAVVVFSTIDPDLRVRYYEKVSVIWHGNDKPGCPCFDAGCHALPCLNSIRPQEILDAVKQWVTESRPVPVTIESFVPTVCEACIVGQL